MPSRQYLRPDEQFVGKNIICSRKLVSFDHRLGMRIQEKGKTDLRALLEELKYVLLTLEHSGRKRVGAFIVSL